MDAFLGCLCSWRNVYWTFLVKSWVWSWPLAKWQWYIINPNWTFIRLSCNVLKFICDVLRDLVPFVQFKKREKHPWRSATFCNKSNTSSISVFHMFKIVQMVPNRAKHHIWMSYVHSIYGTCPPWTTWLISTRRKLIMKEWFQAE